MSLGKPDKLTEEGMDPGIKQKCYDLCTRLINGRFTIYGNEPFASVLALVNEHNTELGTPKMPTREELITSQWRLIPIGFGYNLSVTLGYAVDGRIFLEKYSL